MAPSTCDQKKAEIVRRFENQCLAENKKAKAIYELRCLEVQEKYETKKKQACDELKQQELNELTEIKKLYEAEMEPIKAKHAEERSAIRERYGVATPEVDLRTSVTSGPPSSPTLVAASQRLAGRQKAKAGNKNSVASNRSHDNTQESSDETDTSIPAVAPQEASQATSNARSKRGPKDFLTKKRKRTQRLPDSDDEESEYSQNKQKEDEQDDTSDGSFPGSQDRPSGRVLKTPRGNFAQRYGPSRTLSSGPPTKTRDVFESRAGAKSSSHKTDSQAGREDEGEGTYSGPEGNLLTSEPLQLHKLHAATESDPVDPSLESTG